jgi:hypothetical protein
LTKEIFSSRFEPSEDLEDEKGRHEEESQKNFSSCLQLLLVLFTCVLDSWSKRPKLLSLSIANCQQLAKIEASLPNRLK